jgi:hypothetical protein
MVAPSMTAPLESFTVPLMVAEDCWDAAAKEPLKPLEEQQYNCIVKRIATWFPLLCGLTSAVN